MTAPNSTYTEALTAAIANYSTELADNISNNNALLSFIKKKGNITPFDGGTEILQNINYPGSMPSGWYTGSETLDVTAGDVLTTANFAIKQAFTNVVFTGLDRVIHTGKAQMHDFFKSKIKGAESTLQNIIGAALFYSNTENSGKSIGGLQFLVSDAGTGTVGSIDSSSNTWWKNVVYDFSDNSVTASANTIQAALNNVINKTTYGSEMPDLVVGGLTYYNYFEDSMQKNQRFMNVDEAKGGFQGYQWKGAFVTFDPNCSDTRMYVLNTDYLHLRPSKNRNFVTDKEKASVNQDAVVTPIYWAGNMTVSSRKKQGIIVA